MTDEKTDRRAPRLAIQTIKKTGRRYARCFWWGRKQKPKVYGGYNSPDEIATATAGYHADLAIFESGGEVPKPMAERTVTVNDLIASFKRGRARKHGPDWWDGRSGGRPRRACAVLGKLFGTLPVEQFGPKRLTELQRYLNAQRQVKNPEKHRHCRTEINKLVNEVRAVFRHGVAEELVPESLYQALRTVEGLGASEGGEGKPRTAVAVDVFLETVEHVHAPLDDVLRLMWLTGARSEEILNLKPGMVDTGDPEVWTVDYAHHKTAHRGKKRWISFQGQAKDILARHMLRAEDAFCFAPSRNATKDHYVHGQLNQAVKYALKKANRIRAREGKKPLPRWTPTFTRHSFATRVADSGTSPQLLLGHSNEAMTRHYVENSQDRAKALAKALEESGNRLDRLG